MLGVLGRSDDEDPVLKCSVELADQLKALRLARCGGISVSLCVLCVSPASVRAWSGSVRSSDSSFDLLDSASVTSELAKNLQEKRNESKISTEAQSAV